MSLERALFEPTSEPIADPASTPEGTEPAPESSNAPSRFDKRIAQLTAQKGELARQLDEAVSGRAALETRLAQLEQRLTNTPEPGAGEDFKGWESLRDTELAKIMADNPNDPAIQIRANKILARRQVEEALAAYEQKRQSETADSQKMSAMQGLIVSTFGADAVNNPQSDLRKTVAQLANVLGSEYGQDRFEKDPLALMALFSEAGRQTNATKLKGLTQEVEQLRAKVKKYETVQAGVHAAAAQSEAVKEKLAAGDVHGAVGELKFTKFLRGDLAGEG